MERDRERREEKRRMENSKNVKRSIRIPKGMNEVLWEKAKVEGKSVNKVILGIIEKEIERWIRS